MLIIGQAGNYFKFSIFKETPPDMLTKNEIIDMIDQAQKNTGIKVVLKFQNNALRKNFFSDGVLQPTLF